MREQDNVVMGQRSQRGGRKFDTWEVRFPQHEGYRGLTVDVYVERDVNSTYTFFAELDPEKGHPFKARLAAGTPTEVRDLLNAATQKDIEQHWTKQLLVSCDAYGNDRTEPEAAGTHQLTIEWHIVYTTTVNKNLLYVYEGQLWQRDIKYGHAGKFIPWTAERERVLRDLGAVIHTANIKLEELLAGDKLAKALDNSSGLKLLTGGR